MFDSGVDSYITGYYVVEVHFPVSKGKADISCNQCPFYGRTSKTCQLNKSVVHYPDRYVGYNCPLEIKEEKVERDINETDSFAD